MDSVNLRVEIAAESSKVFEALTDPKIIIRWFAEHAEVSLKARQYRFWGRFTPESGSASDSRHSEFSFKPNKSISFKWRLRDADTRVQIDLSEKSGSKTELTLLHEGLSPWQKTQFSVADFWTISLENLRSLLERNIVGPRPDFATTPKGSAGVSIEIDAPKEKVFDALVNPQQLDRYIATKAVVEPVPGGKYSLGWKSGGPIKILEIVPNEKLSYLWVYQEEPNTIATWTLEGSGGKTRLTVVHSGFAPDRPCDDYKIGWLAFLVYIKGLVETGPAWTAPKTLVRDCA